MSFFIHLSINVRSLAYMIFSKKCRSAWASCRLFLLSNISHLWMQTFMLYGQLLDFLMKPLIVTGLIVNQCQKY